MLIHVVYVGGNGGKSIEREHCYLIQKKKSLQNFV